MQVIGGILYAMFLVCMMVGIFFGVPKLMDYIDLNLARDHMENRAQRKVKNLRSQLRVIELEKEAVQLERKLQGMPEEKNSKEDLIRQMLERNL